VLTASALQICTLLIVACQQPTAPSAKSTSDLSKVPSQELPQGPAGASADDTEQRGPLGELKPTGNAETWQRARECAEQTDRLAQRNRWVLGLPDPVWLLPEWGDQREVRLITDLLNHYSAQFRHCYVELHYIVRKLPGGRQSSPNDHLLLFDAFEGREVASCTEIINSVEGRTIGSREQCMQFVNERMDK